MPRVLRLLTVAPLAVAVALVPALPREAAADAGRSSYVVQLRDGVDARGVARAVQAQTTHVYGNAIDGFAAQLTDGQVRRLRALDTVVSVEADGVITADATQTSAPWGLDRSDQRSSTLDGRYSYTSTGARVTAYVIDSGIQSSNVQFTGRARNVFDAFGGNGEDCNGHGTHVAGTIGAATFGIAKSVALRGVRVLDCEGQGRTSDLIAGIDWVHGTAAKPAVANISASGPYSSALTRAVKDLNASGVFVSVAAGNKGADACNYSPSSASGILAVAAIDRSTTRASFSNHGPCVDLYAPGVAIASPSLTSRPVLMSGTSMAAPHAAGVAALYKSRRGDISSASLLKWFASTATTGAVRGNPGATPNRLLHTGAL